MNTRFIKRIFLTYRIRLAHQNALFIVQLSVHPLYVMFWLDNIFNPAERILISPRGFFCLLRLGNLNGCNTGRYNIAVFNGMEPSQCTMEIVLTTCVKTGWIMWAMALCALSYGVRTVVYDGSALVPDKLILLRLVEKLKVTILGTSPKYLSELRRAGIKPSELPRFIRTMFLTVD